MRMTEAEYKKLCEKQGKTYKEPKNNLMKDIENQANRKLWEDRRSRRVSADKGSSETFIIKGRLPALNDILAEALRTIYAYSEMKAEYSEIAMTEALSQIKYNYSFVDIDVLWIEKNRRRDKDNIAAAIKFILDGIVDAGIIENDGWSQINNITHSYDIDPKNPRIEITIKELN